MTDREIEEGDRIGRFIVFRDTDGRLHAVAAGSVNVVCECEVGGVLMLSGGRLLQVERSLATVLSWLDGRGP